MPQPSHKSSTAQLTRAIFVVTLMTLVSACTADLRPDAIRENGIKSNSEERGRKLLRELPEAHGGLAAWRDHGNARVVLRDEWPSWVTRTAAMPWFENNQLLEVTIRLGQDDGRVRFAEAPNKDLEWGLQDWTTYTVSPDGELRFEDDETIRFWVPTVGYFFEAPFRLWEADVVSWIGEEKVDGRTYDKVFLSWGKAEPQATIDQYVAWIDRETGRLGFLAYTVRDIMQSVEGFMRYTNYEQIDGIWVARTMAVVDGTDTMEGLHRMEVESVKFGVELPPNYFVPDPTKSRSKHQ